MLAKVDRARVRGIGVSGQQHGFVPLDEKGGVIRPAKLWCDTSTVAECALLTKKLGGAKAAIRKAGLLFLPGFTAPKILWLKRHEPQNYRRLRHVLLPHDYLNFHLTGNFFMEYGDASGTALARRAQTRLVEGRDRAPSTAILPTGCRRSRTRTRPRACCGRTWRRNTACRSDVVVSAGGGDNMMGAIGTGNVAPGRRHRQLRHERHDLRVRQEAGRRSCGRNRGVLFLDRRLAAVAVHDECDDRDRAGPGALRVRTTRRSNAAVAAAPAGADGLVLLPYLEGERTPNVPEGSGVFLGLNATTFKAGHLARAAMEGVTMGMNYGLRRLAELGVKAREIRVTGGGAKSPVWRQLMADIFGVPVVAMVEDEGAALGGALQAAWCTALLDGSKAKITDFTDGVVALDESTRCQPDKANVARYRELQALQDRLSLALRPVFPAQRRLAQEQM